MTNHLSRRKKLFFATLLLATGLSFIEGCSRLILPDRESYCRRIKQGEKTLIIPNDANPLYKTDLGIGIYEAIRGADISVDNREKMILLGGSTMAGNTLNGGLPVEKENRLNEGIYQDPKTRTNGSPGTIAYNILKDSLENKLDADHINLAVAGHGIRTATEIVSELKQLGLNKHLTVVWLDGHNEYLKHEVAIDIANSRLPKKALDLAKKSRAFSNLYYIATKVVSPFVKKGSSSNSFSLEKKEREIVKASIETDFKRLITALEGCPDSYLYMFIPPANLEFAPSSTTGRDKSITGECTKRVEEARELAKKGELEETLALLKEVRNKGPYNPQFCYILGRVQSRLGLEEEAKTSLKEALELDPSPSRILSSTSEIMKKLEQPPHVRVVDLSDLKESIWGNKEFLDGMHPNEETAMLFGREIAKVIAQARFKRLEIVFPSIDRYCEKHPLSRDFENLGGATNGITAHEPAMTSFYIQRVSESAKKTALGRLVLLGESIQKGQLNKSKGLIEEIEKAYGFNAVEKFIRSNSTTTSLQDSLLEFLFHPERKMTDFTTKKEKPRVKSFRLKECLELYINSRRINSDEEVALPSEQATLLFVRGNKEFLFTQRYFDSAEITTILPEEKGFITLPNQVSIKDGRFLDTSGREVFPYRFEDGNIAFISRLSDDMFTPHDARKQTASLRSRLPSTKEITEIIQPFLQDSQESSPLRRIKRIIDSKLDSDANPIVKRVLKDDIAKKNNPTEHTTELVGNHAKTLMHRRTGLMPLLLGENEKRDVRIRFIYDIETQKAQSEDKQNTQLSHTDSSEKD